MTWWLHWQSQPGLEDTTHERVHILSGLLCQRAQANLQVIRDLHRHISFHAFRIRLRQPL